MRFGLRAKSVEKVDEVKAGLIESRRIIFTPSVDLKDDLANTAIQVCKQDADISSFYSTFVCLMT